MTRGRTLLTTTAAAFLLAVPWSGANATHIRIDSSDTTQQPSTTVIVPAPGSTAVVPGPPAVTTYAPVPAQTVQAEEIKANQVRAQTIYANKIEADDVQGVVHQTKSVKVENSHGDIKAPYVAASVIYADEIKANSVVADQIYVRDLRRR